MQVDADRRRILRQLPQDQSGDRIGLGARGAGRACPRRSSADGRRCEESPTLWPSTVFRVHGDIQVTPVACIAMRIEERQQHDRPLRRRASRCRRSPPRWRSARPAPRRGCRRGSTPRGPRFGERSAMIGSGAAVPGRRGRCMSSTVQPLSTRPRLAAIERLDRRAAVRVCGNARRDTTASVRLGGRQKAEGSRRLPRRAFAW